MVRPVVGAERCGGHLVGAVEAGADRGAEFIPAVADGDGIGDLRAGSDDGVAGYIGLRGDELAVGAGDGEVFQVSVGRNEAALNIVEMTDEFVAMFFQQLIFWRTPVGGFAIGEGTGGEC